MLYDVTEGLSNQQKFYTNPLKNNVYLPQPVRIEDIDGGVRDTIVRDFTFNDEVGEKVPIVINFDMDRYGMFMSMSEAISQKDFINFMQEGATVNAKPRSLSFPFMVLTKSPEMKRGTRFSSSHSNIPFDVDFPIYEEKYMEGGKLMARQYTIKQPLHIDLTYYLYMFTTDPIELQRFGQLVLRKFKSLQYYTEPNGHYMPMLLESLSDDSQIDIDSRQFYISKAEINLQGYLLEEPEMKIVPLINTIGVSVQNDFVKSTDTAFKDLINVNGNFSVRFGRKSPNVFYTSMKSDFVVNRINISDSSKYEIYLNGSKVEVPFQGKAKDELMVAHFFGNSKPIEIIFFNK